MTLRKFLFLLIVVLFVGACKRNSGPPPSAPEPAAAPGIPQLAQAQGGAVPAPQTK